MSDYLSKEEIKQWRSSLEKITLEDYAARLGKVIEEEKHTNDLVDIVLKGHPVVSSVDNSTMTKGEKISSIAEKTFERERELSDTPFSISVKNRTNGNANKQPAAKQKSSSKEPEVSASSVADSKDSVRDIVNLTFSKALTDREQMVFDYFVNNKNKIVYAKDLATLLGLPRDYVYKYIKNLRAKIEGDKLQNSENGGYILNI